MQIIFLSGTKCLWLAQCVNKFLVRHKKFGLAQNILQPVKGQGISFNKKNILSFQAETVGVGIGLFLPVQLSTFYISLICLEIGLCTFMSNLINKEVQLENS